MEDPPDRSAQSGEGLLDGGEMGQAPQAQGFPKAGHLLKPIDQLAVSSSQLELETVEGNQLWLGEGVLGELGGVGQELLGCQMQAGPSKLQELGVFSLYHLLLTVRRRSLPAQEFLQSRPR